MPVVAKFLFTTPQHEIASLLRKRLDHCTSASVVVGFMSEAGVKLLAPPLMASPSKLRHLVVGSGSLGAFEACDWLITAGVNASNVRVHLGFARKKHTGRSDRGLLHSKIYLMDMGDGTSSAFIGSHNLSENGLAGLNGEACVLLEGPSSASQFVDIRCHIAEAARQAVPYDPSMKAAYARWAGFRDASAGAWKRLVVMAELPASGLPQPGEAIYFEIPQAIRFNEIPTDVHLYLFDTLPAPPRWTFQELSRARRSWLARSVGLENDRGGVELRADWLIQSPASTLRRASGVVRPAPGLGMQQVRIEVKEELPPRTFEYVVESKHGWRPVFDDEDSIPATDADRMLLEGLSLKHKEVLSWYRVKGLEPNIPESERPHAAAMRRMSPESGNYIVMLPGRKRRPTLFNEDNA
ncbi:MAG: hypothetical protein F4Y20_06475 [Acidobacteria bacterium]|nr:hypothetical protein [Acidobacteriota bacterium]MYH22381.1 hypothetical protein [Acidobacteriota bacterium]MYK80457.1 hypothetical protein [Acidobacteriota bacterium]